MDPSSARAAPTRWGALTARLPAIGPRRLATRIVALFLLLLLLVQLAGFGAIRGSIEDSAHATLTRELETGERIWRRLLEERQMALRHAGQMLLADRASAQALLAAEAGLPLEVPRKRAGVAVLAWLDASGAVRAWHADADAAPEPAALRQLAGAVARSAEPWTIASLGALPIQFVALPVGDATPAGFLLLGAVLDSGALRELHQLSGLQSALLRAGPGGSVETVAATLALPAGVHFRESRRITVGGEAMVARRVALTHDAEGPSVVLLRSVTEAIAPYLRLQWSLAVITGVGVLVFVIGALVTARRVTTPLAALVKASERLGRGDYEQPLAHLDRDDEVGELARAFDRMRLSIARHQAEMRRLAYTDRLTGLPNRVAFRDAVHALIKRGTQPRAAVVLLDLDRFKQVNDVLGFGYGDRLLRAVAERLAGHGMRDGDLVARLSSDQFALLLPGRDAAAALGVAERIADVFELPLVIGDQSVDLSAGFGVGCWPDHADDADTLISRAEVAMHGAKRRTLRTLVYEPGLEGGNAQTLSLLSELKRAVERDELRLFLQPKIAFADGKLVGAEALVRWQHPERGMVPPLQFIPFAEQTGFVRQLTLWMFEQVARQWSRLAALGLERVSVNLSTRDLADPELPAKLGAILHRHGVPAEVLCLEITESAMMEDPQRAEATLNALSSTGFKLSIDDFGTGYSSLAYLKRLPVDELKIDKSFVMAMEREAGDAKIVRSTIDLAHNLGLSVVAEGVENAAVWRQLRALRCDEAQGFHLSRPMPVEEIAAFAARWLARAAGQRAAEVADS